MPRMFRRGSRRGLHPVNSRKEIVDSILLAVAAGVTSTVNVATAIENYVGTTGTIEAGSTINWVSLQITYQADGNLGGATDWYLAKNPGGNLTLPIPGVTGGDDNKKFIFHEAKGLNGDRNGGGPNLRQVVIRIPPRFKRMGVNDVLTLRLRSTVAYDVCIKAIYKRYS